MTRIAILTALLITLAVPAHAQSVTFSGIADAAPGRFFDADLTFSDAPNSLAIGLDAGFDAAAFKTRDFKASLLAYSYPAAADTIAFTVTAPDGYYVATVSYQEVLLRADSRTGRSFAVTQMTVAGVPRESLSVAVAGSKRVVPVTITTSLVAANADVRVLSGRVIVTVRAIGQ